MSETEIRSGVQLPMVNSAAARRLSDTSWPFERGINLSLVLLGFSAASYAVEGRIAAMVVALCAGALVLVAMRIATSADFYLPNRFVIGPRSVGHDVALL